MGALNTCYHVPYMHLQSSSITTIVTCARFPRVTLLGREFGAIVRVKFSLPSNILSVAIATSNETLVTPAENVTVYGPES